MKTPIRVLFLGTPDFAVPTLKELINFKDTVVVGAVCQPDRPAGRGNKLHVPPVKEVALEHGIPVLQPEKLSKSPETVEAMRALSPDLIVMVAFGQILKKNVLDLPPLGVMNLHASVLPKYRGAAPINWSIINGDTESGITTMFSDPGVDTGPMLLKKSVAITDEMTSEDLAHQLSTIGSKLVIETIEKIIDGTLQPIVQDSSQATFAPMLSKELGHIDWTNGAKAVHDLARGLLPWPTAATSFRSTPTKILKTKVHENGSAKLAPGTILRDGEKVLVACGDGSERLELITVQPANKNRMDAKAWANGLRLADGEAFDK